MKRFTTGLTAKIFNTGMISASINTIFFLTFRTGHYHKHAPLTRRLYRNYLELFIFRYFELIFIALVWAQAMAFVAVATNFELRNRYFISKIYKKQLIGSGMALPSEFARNAPDDLRRKVSVPVNRYHLFLLLMILVPISATADTIVLKSGKRVEVDMAWEENDQVKGTLAGVSLTFPKSKVERIEKEKADAATGQNKGFKFDMWYSGMNLSTVESVAEKNNITLQRVESNTAEAESDSSAIETDSQATEKMEYSEHILGKLASIELIFTPLSQKLHQLSIHWPQVQDSMADDFFNKVISSLINGYGQPAKKKSTLFDTTYRWNINKSSHVELNWNKEVVVITYLDAGIE